MNPVQKNWDSRRFERRFYAEIVSDITTNDVILVENMHNMNPTNTRRKNTGEPKCFGKTSRKYMWSCVTQMIRSS